MGMFSLIHVYYTITTTKYSKSIAHIENVINIFIQRFVCSPIFFMQLTFGHYTSARQSLIQMIAINYILFHITTFFL